MATISPSSRTTISRSQQGVKPLVLPPTPNPPPPRCRTEAQRYNHHPTHTVNTGFALINFKQISKPWTCLGADGQR